jgi:N-acetylglucosaminyldiphosphoundecaprenol N-acetyl-beta-D-mannosaminyltransferase
MGESDWRHLMGEVPTTTVGGLQVAALTRAETAELMITVAKDRARAGPPPLFTSANGEVLSRCSSKRSIRSLFEPADLINADGQPMVFVSRALASRALPERVATSDLFHDVAFRAVQREVTFAVIGGHEDENCRAVENIRHMYPGISIVRRSHGYLDEIGQRGLVEELSRLRPDIVWLCLGVPREQAFYWRWRHELHGVGIVKTGGGLINFLSGTRRRAPRLVQSMGLEWLFRLALEPRRLFWRYALTNPHSLMLLLTSTR